MIFDLVKAALDEIGITNIFARIGEANFGVDKLDPSQFPVAVFVLPETQTTVWTDSGAGRRLVEIRVWFLERIPDENDPTADQAYAAIGEMTDKAESFWLNLQKDPQVVITEDATHATLFAAFDATLYGVDSSAQVEFESTAKC